MSPDRFPDDRTALVEVLQTLGLSSYAAQTLAALLAFEDATAREVSEASAVPRPRVYDAVDELEAEGLVRVADGTPRRFSATSARAVGRHFATKYADRLDRVSRALAGLGYPVDRFAGGLWRITGRDSVATEVQALIESGTDEIVYAPAAGGPRSPVEEGLRAALDRGVSLSLGRRSRQVAWEFGGSSQVDLHETLRPGGEQASGRILVVDRQRALVSVYPCSNPERQRDRETAYYSSGPQDGFAVIVSALLLSGVHAGLWPD